MLTLSHAIALLLGTGALATGFLAGCAWCWQRRRAGYVALAVHRDDMATLRRRYRRRLRAQRDARLRHAAGEEQLHGQLQRAERHGATETRLRTAAEAAVVKLRGHLDAQEMLLAGRDHALATACARATALEDALLEARERIAALENDQGLMRIERDELVAHTQRLRTLAPPPPATGAPAPPPAADAKRPDAALRVSRAELAERNARIHELECCLRESATRIDELESSLQTWKYRIAPLALQAKRQPPRAAPDPPQNVQAPPASDDLKRIRGIGRALARKINAAGIHRFDQLARLSPAELANLAGCIGVAATRPASEHWAEQAQTLAGPAPQATAYNPVYPARVAFGTLDLE